METYFGRLLDRWRELAGTLPQAVVGESEEQSIYVGRPDENGLVFWEPKKKCTNTDLSDVETALGVRLHPSIAEYFNAYWFCSIGERLAGMPCS